MQFDLRGYKLTVHTGSLQPRRDRECVLVDIVRSSDGKKWQAGTLVLAGIEQHQAHHMVLERMKYALDGYELDRIDFRFALPLADVNGAMPDRHTCYFHRTSQPDWDSQ